MILGVSHVAVRTRELEQDIKKLCVQGWELEFVDHAVAVHPYERTFLSASCSTVQSLALLRHPSGLPALELVSPTMSEAERLDAKLVMPPADSRRFSGTIHVDDLVNARDFFVKHLGFCEAESNIGRGAKLAMRRPLRQWCFDLTLEQLEQKPNLPESLDKPGWFVLALLTTDIDQGAKTLAGYCMRATPPFEIQVNGNQLKLALGTLSTGFGIEMVQIGAKR
jgi:hypothetical protein